MKAKANHVGTTQASPIAPPVKAATSRPTALTVRAARVARAPTGATVSSEKIVISDRAVISAPIVSKAASVTTEVIVTNGPAMMNVVANAVERATTSAASNVTIVRHATTMQDVAKSHAAVTILGVTIHAETTVLHGASPPAESATEALVSAVIALTVVAQVAARVVTPELAEAHPVAAKAKVSQVRATTRKTSFKSATRASASVRKPTALKLLVS